MPQEYQSRRLSWIEITLLLVGALIVIALVLPAVQVSREAARRTQSRNNLLISMELRKVGERWGRKSPR